MLDSYTRVDLDGRVAYIRKDRVEPLREVSTVIFDCDGVLIDAHDSYNRSISRTVSYLAKKLLRTQVSEEVISDSVIYGFRKSGGFNNDWDTTYSILLYLFTKLPDDILDRFRELYRLFQKEGAPREPYERVSKAKKLFAEAESADKLSDSIGQDLLKLAEKADSRGLISIEEVLLNDDLGEAQKGFTMLMSYPGIVGVSTVMTVFEEFFLGSDLFLQKYGFRSRFVKDYQGLVASERSLVNEETLTLLAKVFGGSSLGIVSGRSIVTAEFTLRDILKRFNTGLTVFVEDEIAVAMKKGDAERLKEIGKPNPYALLKAEESAPQSGRILYVGDSREDIIMVERANDVTDRFIAAGVYGCTHNPSELMDMFLENGAYLITESVNDLPRLFEMIRREKI